MATTETKDKYTAEYWATQVSSSEERYKKFVEQGKESIKVYSVRDAQSELVDVQRRINVWWYVLQTLLPAFYSSTPKAEAELRKKAGTIVHQIGATVLERATQYVMDEHFDFDEVALGSASHLLLTGMACLWPRYTPEIEYDDDDQPAKKTEDRAVLDLVLYTDFLESDGRNESEIEWRGKRAYLNREQVTSLLGKATADKMSYNSYPEILKDGKFRDSIQQFEGKAEIWEIHSRVKEKVYFVHRVDGHRVCEPSDPPIEYEDFWPCEVIRTTTDPDSLIPVSDYFHVKDQILEVERLTTRIHAVTQAIRANHAYDASLGDKMEELITGDLKMVPLMNWPSYKSRGGLGASIEGLPIEQYTKTLEVLMNSRQVALQQLYESMRASDLLRGTSDPDKTATANRLEHQWSSLGLVVRQNQFARFVGRAVGKLGTIIASKFDPEYIREISDADTLIAQSGGQIQFEQVAELLRAEGERCYRIQIATDSMIALDEAQERAERLELLNGAGGFFQQLSAVTEKYPPLISFGLQALQFVMRSYKGGKELEPLFTTAFAQLGPILEQQAAAAAQQPPTPGAAEAQARLQIAQIESQDAHQKSMIELQTLLMKAQQEEQKSQFDRYVKERELAIDEERVKVEAMKVQATVDVNAAKIELERTIAELRALLEAQGLKIDQHHAAIAEFQAVHNARIDKADTHIRAHEAVTARKAAEAPLEVHAPSVGD